MPKVKFAVLDRLNDFESNVVRDVRVQVNNYTASATLSESDKTARTIWSSASNIFVTLPATWKVGESVVIRRRGSGEVYWTLASGATVELPSDRATHTRIALQNAEILCHVIENSDGASAVWCIEGPTA